MLKVVRRGVLRWPVASLAAVAVVAAGLAGGVPQASATPTAPSVPVGTGPVANATFLNFPISDKVSLQVNVGSGNALLTTSDLVLPEAGTDLTLGSAYNSLLAGSSVSPGADGYGWRQREGVDVRLYPGSNGATFLGEDGTAGTFTAPAGSGTTYGSPAVFHATLSSAPASACSGSAYQLTWHSSGEVMCFNSTGLLTSQADRNGNTTAYSYNGSSQETTIAYTPKGGSSPTESATASYTGSYLTGLTESGGSSGTRSVTYTVNSSGDLTSVKQADGTTITLGYDGSHDLTSVKNAAGAATTLAYNSARQVTSVAQRYGSGSATATTRLSYVSATETEVATPTTNQSEPVSSVPDTTYTINSQDLVTNAVDPGGNSRSDSYTPFNDVATATNGLAGGKTANTYTANSGESLNTSASPTGSTAKLAYTNANSGTDPTAAYLPSSSTDAQGNATAFTYNGAGNLSTSTSATAAAANVTDNADGTPATSADPDGGVTSYSYNSLHQLTKVTPPTSGSLKPVTLAYDGFGRVSTVTDGDGNIVTYTYDLADRVTKQAYAGGPHPLTVSYVYDGAGNLKTQTDPSGTTSYAYDGRNQVLTKAATSGGGTLAYNYDADGNLLSAKDAGGTTTYAYNDLDQLTSMHDPKGLLWAFAYNQAGERTTTWFDTNATESSWAGKIVDSFDASGRITRVQDYDEETPSDVVSDVSYHYTANSSAATTCGTTPPTGDTSLVQYSVNNVTSVTSIYCYDDGDRLTKVTNDVTNDSNTTYSFGYDGDGNVTTGAVSGTLNYNTANQITTSGFGYDGAGNLTTDPDNGTLTYNDAGQLISASNAAGGGPSGGSESFSYAGANQDQPLSDGSATSITYGLAGQDGQPWIDSYKSAGTANYIIRDQQGDPLGMVRGSTSYMFVTDNIGSVTAIVDDCGCTDAVYDYTPYGTVAAKYNEQGGNLVKENLIGYAGALTDAFTDATTGHIHLGDRWYDPGTGTFTSQDANSYLASPSNGNRYAYAGDNPANYTDPTGQSFLDNVFGIQDLINELDAQGTGDQVKVFLGVGAGLLTDVACNAALGFADVPSGGAASLLGETGCTVGAADVDKMVG